MIFSTGANAGKPGWFKDSARKLETELVARYGEKQRERIVRGMDQVVSYWSDKDGNAAVFEEFVRANFAAGGETLDAMFVRFEYILEKVNGSVHEMSIAMRLQTDLDAGPILPIDRVFAAYDVGAHITDDLFANKIAFTALLNFPLTTLEERLTNGKKWTRREWAEARLAQRFSKRVPARVNLRLAEAGSASDQYIADYNIWMHHLLDDRGERIFPAGLRLLSHWNLRDELKANYGNKVNGIEKQRMILKVMERIVDQTIPGIVVNNPHIDWNPVTNEVFPASVSDSDEDLPPDMKIASDREPDTRYRILLDCFLASKGVDEYSPSAPSLIARRFDEGREIREEDVEKMLVAVLSSPLAGGIGKLIEERLGRKLEPFDIWYNGFKSTGKYSEKELDRIVGKKYPDPEAFEKDIPRFLQLLDFSKERADGISRNILVEAARGSGHASGGEMRHQPARLRTRIGKNGMDYKGFNIAVHELGHNVEQTITMNDIDHTLLAGVPNTAFTEAFAFVFQGNDLMLLGLDPGQDRKSEAMHVINDFWMTYEISGVSLVDMKIWHWMYDNPDATPAELREATLDISRLVWNRYFAPVFGVKDSYILGIYSHIIHSFLYIPDYAIGHMIAFQVKEQMKKAGNIGREFERMALMGNIAPDLWMMNAAGTPVGADALLEATEKALKNIRK